MKFAWCSMLMIAAAVLSGCASVEHEQLAPAGVVNIEGDHVRTLQAPDDGQVTVYDINMANTVFSGTISKGQLLAVDPMNKQVTINGMLCNTNPLRGGDSLKIIFEKGM